MKIILSTLFLVAGAWAQGDRIQCHGPACTFDDPLQRDGSLPINVTFDPLLRLEIGSEVTNLVAEGLSGYAFNLSMHVLTGHGWFDFTIPYLSGNATYNASGYLDTSPLNPETFPTGNLFGSGFGTISATNVNFKGDHFFQMDSAGNTVTFKNLTLESLSFDSLSVDLGSNITIGGSVPNWAEVSANIKANFDRNFAENRDAITEKLLSVVNNINANYNPEEIWFFLLSTCLQEGEEPEC